MKSFSAPVHVSINTTAKCNLRCSHCSGSYGERSTTEMDLNGWTRVVDFLSYSNVYTVNLTGGEPTQAPYIFELLDMLRKHNIFVTISSNLIIGETVLKKLLQYKSIIRNVKTSIDGYDSKTNGIIRQSETFNSDSIFDTINRNYNQLKKENVNITVVTVLHKNLLKNFKAMQEYIIKIHPNSWVVSPIVSIGRAYTNEDVLVPDFDELMSQKYDRIKNEMAEHQIEFSQVDFPSQEKADPYGCPACNESVIINYDGTIAPCQLSLEILSQNGFDFPNVLNTEFDKIWHCESFERFRTLQCQGCEDCEIHTQCKRCLPQSLRYFEDIYSPTPYCVSVADSIGLKRKNYWENKLKERTRV